MTPARAGVATLPVDESEADLERRFGGLRRLYGDAGYEHGGDIPGHGSHEVGLDIDIWPIRTDNGQCSAGRITW